VNPPMPFETHDAPFKQGLGVQASPSKQINFQIENNYIVNSIYFLLVALKTIIDLQFSDFT
jgi:hypothetical protein